MTPMVPAVNKNRTYNTPIDSHKKVLLPRYPGLLPHPDAPINTIPFIPNNTHMQYNRPFLGVHQFTQPPPITIPSPPMNPLLGIRIWSLT